LREIFISCIPPFVFFCGTSRSMKQRIGSMLRVACFGYFAPLAHGVFKVTHSQASPLLAVGQRRTLEPREGLRAMSASKCTSVDQRMRTNAPSSKQGTQADRRVLNPWVVYIYTFQSPISVTPCAARKLVSETPIVLCLTFSTSAKERIKVGWMVDKP